MATINQYFYRKYNELESAIGERERATTEGAFELQKIHKIIMEHESEDYSDIIANTDDWWLFYHLSELRKSLLNWYDFKPEAQLLEVGAEFGALTGLFCDRCQHVTVTEPSMFKANALYKRYQNRINLDIYVGEAEYIYLDDWNSKFDYIVVVRTLENKGYGYLEKKAYIEYLERLQTYLKPDGKIILVVDNRCGIQYFCGAREAHTGKPFDGINGYPNGTTGCSFQRKELIELLKASGLNNYKFYYPMPDYQMPQLIFTDEYHNGINISERLNCYYENTDTLLAVDRRLYEDIVENGALSFLANSFLVECSKAGEMSDIIYAVTSTDRGEVYASATTMHKDCTVQKKALYNAGNENIFALYKNIKDLEVHGIKVLESKFENDTLIMPFSQSKGLTQVLQNLVVQDKEHFIRIFDEIYEDIQKASELVDAKENAMIYSRENADYGPILKKVYIDLVPGNCFYDDGTLIFYDQEFVKDYYPAKFALYRGLKYTYMSMWSMENYLPLQQMKERYDITEDIWEDFEKEEADFIKMIRNSKLYQKFYEWDKVDDRMILDRADILEYRGTNVTSWEEDSKLRQVQRIGLDMLCEVKRICEKHGLKYYLFYGTMLGAVRHQGFIPWDDDVDIAMPRQDYDSFLEIAKRELAERYFLETMESETGRFYGGYSKLRDSYTTAINIMRDWEKDYNKGLFIDILPLDTCYNDIEKNERLRKKILLTQKMIVSFGDMKESLFPEITSKEWEWYQEMAKQIGYNGLVRMLNGLCNCVESETGVTTVLMRFLQEPYKVFKKEWFEPARMIKFEGIDFPIPNVYDECLKLTAGINYMSYPSQKYRTNKHLGDLFLVPDVPYAVYEHRFFDFFKDYAGQKIIVVGHNSMSEDFFYKHDQEYPSAFTVDDCTEKIGLIQWGYETKPMESIFDIPKEERIIIICAQNFQHYEKILKNMGIENYYIHLHNKWWLLNGTE